ncbi:MAG: hypothetical protein Q8Q09_16585 [Deltaproteobacteria bacterium]|nr:hypothetical protein [Deltaproteobacteria bacterium]
MAIKAAADTSREGMVAVGRSMLRYSDGRALSQARTLSLNGARLKFSTGSTPDSVRQVIDHYAADCRRNDGQLGEQFRSMLPALRERSQAPAPATPDFAETADSFTMFRFSGDSEGMLFCFDVGTARMDLREFSRRLEQVAATGDLSKVGNFRYVFASRATPSDRSTHIVGFWGDGSPVNVTTMFPATGDAPGREVTGAARPTGLRRMFNAYEVGVPYSLSMYSGTVPIGRVEDQLRREMVSNGWQLIPHNHQQAGRPNERLFVFERQNNNLTYFLNQEEGITQVVQFAEEGSASTR